MCFIKTVLILVVLGIVAFILIGFVSESHAQDESQLQEIRISDPDPVPIEYEYLRLKVDWEDKDEVTRHAQYACITLSDREKIECYKEQKYFDKKQTSEKALINFVDFLQEHKVH